MATFKIVQCTCCGSDVTMPQFFNGKPYGYTCILKVAPSQKRVKVEYVQADEYAVSQDGGKFNFAGRVSGFKVVRSNGYSAEQFYGNAKLAGSIYVADGKAFIPRHMLEAK